VSPEFIDKNLAIIHDGRVLSAPIVRPSITTDRVSFASGAVVEWKLVTAKLTILANS
jgi:hypothetical protein